MKKFGLGFLAALLIITAAFLTLDFHWMVSQAQSQSAVASSGLENFKSITSFSPSLTGLFVTGNHPFVSTFQDQLRKKIEHQPNTGEITLLNLPADRFDIPVIMVELIPMQYSWTPFSASADVKLIVSYASNGDLSFRSQPVVQFQSNPNQPALQFSATLTLSDQSDGVISSAGYQNYLSEQWAQAVRDLLQKQIHD